MIEIKIDDMQGRGKKGWVAQIEFDKTSFQSYGATFKFLSPDERTGYGSSRQTLIFAFHETKQPLLVAVNDANYGDRSRRHYLIIRNQTATEFLTLEDAILQWFNFDESSLPELDGSEKQCSWAIKIRQKFIAEILARQLEMPEIIFSITSAKYWIDNRVNFETGSVLKNYT